MIKREGFIPTPTYNSNRKSKLVRGFTLIEMIVSIILVSILIFAVSYIFMEGFRVYVLNRNLIDLRSEGRSALKRMVLEARESQIASQVVTNGFKIRSDIDRDGLAEDIIYQLTGTDIRRTVGAVPDPNAPVLVGNVSSAVFSGLGTKIITITLTLSRQNDTFTIRTRVRARCI